MPPGGRLQDEELDRAAWQAAKAGAIGAAKWGVGAAMLGGAAYFYSPIYRGLTIQFKIYLQMSAMTLGGILKGESYMHDHKIRMRHYRRLQSDSRKWRENEADYESRGTPGVGSEGHVGRREDR
ncbi:hypothetical protein P152DRAFT_434735 [Eremomyces bilateralis CBS 781.70]|uniref:Imidazoleglycerol-phosphate dehydratase n=1 Tax=Eremomyces bilateralis CBS 781.70 TaxID=1392243 RepID=A0A6G1G689_9PEZI|nr:uncharacterized protein P152DRAFT_434735 [Eremomyces bilateralis CBS 781.70]KAF1813532.1 hypothetical protein P152DRAFT_434735 [Eremomyces bilateralis CBS 781.70]